MNPNAILDQALFVAEDRYGAKCRRLPAGAVPHAANPQVEISFQGIPHRFAVEVRNRVDRTGQLGQILATLLMRSGNAKTEQYPLLATSYLTRALAVECRKLKLNFIDTAGNAYLEAPGTFLFVSGNPPGPRPRMERFRAATAAGSRISFALLSRPVLAGASLRELGHAAGVALGSIGPVLKDLQARGLLSNGKPRRLVDPDRLLQEWIVSYPAVLRPKLHPHTYRADPERLLNLDVTQFNAYWGGETGAQKLVGYLIPEQYTMYSRGPLQPLLLAGRMRTAAVGNVQVLDAFWPEASNGILPHVAPPLVVYADLMMTGEGRNIEAARLIYEQYLGPALRSS